MEHMYIYIYVSLLWSIIVLSTCTIFHVWLICLRFSVVQINIMHDIILKLYMIYIYIDLQESFA